MDSVWWKEAVVYQIYPRSFKDTTGSGVGDIKGITEKLDYISSLGADVIWLNPIYDSPCDDMGYDISDYRNILHEFGTMHDFEELLHEAHKRNLKIIMDLVVNHTSDQHKWFCEAKKSKDNKYNNYYIFSKGKDDKYPNNWCSIFGGPAWEYNKQTDEYFLHLYAKTQPDLNWDNPDLRKEIYSMMKFWMDKGIDGFRMDVINFISKKPGLPEKPDGVTSEEFYANGPNLHAYLKEMYKEVLSKYDCMTVGECPGVHCEDALKIVGDKQDELNMLFHFESMLVDLGPNGEFFYEGKINLPRFKKVLDKWHKALYNKGWNSIYLMNHDQPRSVSRFGNDKKYWSESAKMLATFQLSLCGTPYIYQGEEIGMTNCQFEPEEFRDIWMINYYKEMKDKGYQKDELLPGLLYRGRDNSRTPFQWDDSLNGGFSKSDQTWIKVNPNYTSINAASQENDRNSILNYFRKMINVRKQNKVLIYGDCTIIDAENKNIYAYKRFDKKSEVAIILNFSERSITFDKISDFGKAELIIGNYQFIKLLENGIYLRPFEAVVIRIK
ncbi:MAG: alpha-glucosidase [bacterium]|nr:alpha-glucosidase [bacterium]